MFILSKEPLIFLESINKLLKLLSAKQKILFLIVSILSIITALLEVTGIASILPFIDLIINPEKYNNNLLIDFIKNRFNKSGNDLTYAMGITVLSLIFFSTALKTYSTFLQHNFSRKVEYDLSKRLISSYLRQNYEWFLNKNSTNLGKNLLIEVANCCNGIVLNLLKIITNITLAFFIFCMLLFVNAKVSIQIFILFSLILFILIYCFKNSTKTLSNLRLSTDKERYKAVGEVFGAVKEVKVASLEDVYIKKFIKPAKESVKVKSMQKILVEMPKYVLEGLILSGLILFLLNFIRVNGDLNQAIPLMSFYIFSIYKLLPSILNLFTSISNFKFNIPSLIAIYKDLYATKNHPSIISGTEIKEPNKSIKFNNIYYKYPQSEKYALKNINLEIKVGSSTGIAGFTGSGKTTLIDILLGLLIPEKGQLCIDKNEINYLTSRSWQSKIGYVSQHIYLSDDSIASNIALGCSPEQFDWDRIEKASKIACLHDFILGLKDNYNTIIGERGVRLSGGQRQRVGLARAFYNSPKILIMDEATSALDNITEKMVMKNIFEESKKITLFIIAHRISTIEKCQQIILLKNGKIEDSGNYQELIKRSTFFRKLALVK